MPSRQVVARNFITHKWRRVIEYILNIYDATDGARRKNKKQYFSRFLGFFRSLFNVKKSVAEIEGFQNSPQLKILYEEDIELEYNMNHENRGIALIFNHEYFADKRKARRNATDIDRDKIARVLGRLQFNVKICNDLTFDEIMDETRKVASMNHENNDCLIIIIMSHGDYGLISSFDEEYIIEDIVTFFTDENCPSLIGKPRLFFVQACRGSLLDAGYDMQLNNFNSENARQSQLTDEVDKQESEEEIQEFVHFPPNHRDFLFVRSAMPRYLSFRSPTRGSWFIQDLCSELEANGTTHEMLELLTRVNRKVSERESQGPSFMNRKKQILCISTMLTKVLRLNIKA